MPRQARLDIPNALHHVIVRSAENRSIVRDKTDRERFHQQFGDIALETDTKLYAWAILPEQIHILLHSGSEGVAPYMRRLLTSYAVTYNRRYNESGALFQERYKSTVVEEKLFFRELVRYIHLLPLRVNAVKNITELNKYPWCGHRAVLGAAEYPWHDRGYVLKWFGKSEKEALTEYRAYIREGAKEKEWQNYSGGGLLRSVGGWDEVKAMRRKKRKMVSDARILGSNAFVNKILKQAEKTSKPRVKGAKVRKKVESTIRQACKKAGIDVNELKAGSRRSDVTAVRLQLAQYLTKDMNVTLVEAARNLGVTPSALSKSLTRSRKG